jgi:peptidoglycan-associated lipoprotein
MAVITLGKTIAVTAVVAWLAGCSTTTSTSDTSDTVDQQQSTMDQDQATTQGTGGDGSLDSSQMGDSSSQPMDASALQNVFYFDFDRAVIKPEAAEALAAHALYLSNHPSSRVVLEGHADERGTREYNMALGERRAKAVGRYLTVQGASGSQLELLSYGEERPVAFGQSEVSWGQNRRVELKYESR